MDSKLYDLSLKLRSLCIFRGLLEDEVICALERLLSALSGDARAEQIDAYSALVAELYARGGESLSGHIEDLVNTNENNYVQLLGAGETPSGLMQESCRAELAVLQEAADLTPEYLKKQIDWQGFLPGFAAEKRDIAASFAAHTADIGRYGYGIYARYHMFRIEGESVVPVENYDRVSLADLVGYKREKKIIIDNTRMLIEGKTASNILLTGDAGTGKSSTVKAVANELHGDGLRIIEVMKEQIHILPKILNKLAANPLKFILFIDDLSFQKNDDNFSTLKAVLEGSVSAKTNNVVIYATSNRRHLVKESFNDRNGDDIHFNDTVQEIMSLSERFGIKISFSRPDKNTYLDIVRYITESRGIEIDEEQLALEAERYALERGIRSPRAAKQFVDGLGK